MPRTITWKVHFNARPEEVYPFLVTQEGREKFWSVSAPLHEGYIHFTFANGQHYNSRVLSSVPNSYFQIDYFDSLVEFTLQEDGRNGTDMTVINVGVLEADYTEVHAGWVSWLLTLKAAVDFQIDFRNHDPERTWDQGFVDN